MINKLFSTFNLEFYLYYNYGWVLRFYKLQDDSVQTFYPPYVKFDDKNAVADLYSNGLRIMNTNISFNFKNEVLNFVSGDTIKQVHLDTIPSLTLGQLRKFFIDNAETFEHLGSHFKDTCLRAEFGYFKLSDDNNIKIPPRFIKAWKVEPNYNDYPCAVYNDSAGILIGYNNGIETFK